MTRRTTLAVAVAAILASGTAGLAQPPAQPTPQQPAAPPLPPPPPPAPPGAPSSDVGVDLSVEVTISRYQGDDLVSSLPYVLALTTDRDGRGSLHMDAEIPVMNRPMPATPANAADPDPARFLPGMSYQYRSVRVEQHAGAAGRAVPPVHRGGGPLHRREHSGGRGVDGSGLSAWEPRVAPRPPRARGRAAGAKTRRAGTRRRSSKARAKHRRRNGWGGSPPDEPSPPAGPTPGYFSAEKSLALIQKTSMPSSGAGYFPISSSQSGSSRNAAHTSSRCARSR